jgi:uncharacterized membrane protein
MFDFYGNQSISVHSGGDGGGLLVIVNDLLSLVETLVNQSPADVFVTLLPGISAMTNLHPLFVHFPIALLSLFLLLELAGSIAGRPDWRKIADWFLYSGTLFAGFTVVAGFIAAATVAHGEEVHEIMELHEHLGVSVFLLASTLSVWRFFARYCLQGIANYFYLAMSVLLLLLLVFAADLGGLMVYKHGVAVAAVPVTESFGEHHHDHNH